MCVAKFCARGAWRSREEFIKREAAGSAEMVPRRQLVGRGLWLTRPPNKCGGVGCGTPKNGFRSLLLDRVRKEQVGLLVTCVYTRPPIVGHSTSKRWPRRWVRCLYMHDFRISLWFGLGASSWGRRLHACRGCRGSRFPHHPNEGRRVASGARINEFDHFRLASV